MSKTEGNGGDWYALPWPQAERQVYKLQRRIYRASQRGDLRAVHRLQKRLLKSWFARCLAVRRVTQDNKGKNTAGVDGVKNLTPEQRLELVGLLLQLDERAMLGPLLPEPDVRLVASQNVHAVEDERDVVEHRR